MSEYIIQKIESGKKNICDSCFHQKVCKGSGNQPCMNCNHYQDAADVAPVRHGWWTWNEEGEIDWEQFYRCSNCGDKEYWESNFCPNCGAKMDLEE